MLNAWKVGTLFYSRIQHFTDQTAISSTICCHFYKVTTFFPVPCCHFPSNFEMWIILHLFLVTPIGALATATDHMSLSSSLLWCHLRLFPGVSETCRPHFFLPISISGVLWSPSTSVALWCLFTNAVVTSSQHLSKPVPLFLSWSSTGSRHRNFY